jgi:NTE family protein
MPSEDETDTLVDLARVGRRQQRRDTTKNVDLVLEGGAVWGVALVGAICTLEAQGYVPQNIAGTSAGAIVAALLAAGYSGPEIRDMMFRQNLASLADKTWKAQVPLIGVPWSVLSELGIHKGDVILQRLREVLARRHVRTFGDLIHPDYADPHSRYHYRLHVIASDVTGRRLLVLPGDARFFGIKPDDLDVALAVRMSMSIPLFFKPVIMRDQGRKRYLITDGSMLSNFPVWLFDSMGKPEWPTFGLRLTETNLEQSLAEALPPTPAPVKRGLAMLIDYGSSLIRTMMEAHDRMYLDRHTSIRTILIPTQGVPSTNFNLAPEQINRLYQSGQQAATEFLKHWNFQQYVAEYRSDAAVPVRPNDGGATR